MIEFSEKLSKAQTEEELQKVEKELGTLQHHQTVNSPTPSPSTSKQQ